MPSVFRACAPPRRIAGLVAVLGLVAGGLTLLPASAARAAETVGVPSSGVWTIDGHGNGHGHGLSQYGAQGGAREGATAAQMLAFYYPGSTPATLGASSVRVLIGDAGSYPTVAAASGLQATGIGTLGTPGATRYRLIPAGGGLALQALRGTTWTTMRTALPARVDFTRNGNPVTMVASDGSTSDYRGTIGGVRSGGSVLTVNRLSLDDYTRGVVPREMPASWPAAALQAQAIAARSYARYEVEHNTGSAYDICDNTNCQVYGGLDGEDARSNAAVAATANRVLTYRGSTIFAQFSSSNGGWTADGGQPYLVARADPWERYSDDPWLNWTRTVRISDVAAYYGMSAVTSLTVTARDGHGDWGGAVLTAVVSGISGGHRVSTSVTGNSLRDAMNLPLDWFHIRPVAVTPSLVTEPGGGATVMSGLTKLYVGLLGSHVVLHTFSSATGWAPDQDLLAPPGTRTHGDPDIASDGNRHADIVARLTDGSLAVRSVDHATASAWRRYPVTMSTSPTVVKPSATETIVFWGGPHSTLQRYELVDGTPVSAPTTVPGVSNVSSGPDAVVNGAGVDVVYRGTDGRIWVVATSSGPTGWRAPMVVDAAHAFPSPPAGLDPSISGPRQGQLDFYYTASDGRLIHTVWNQSNGWTGWAPTGASLQSSPDAAGVSTRQIDVTGFRAGAQVITSWIGSGWTIPKATG